MRLAVFGALAALALSLAAAPASAALVVQPVGLPNGTYNCIAGFRVMLTLGQMTLNNGHYVFKTQNGNGPTTSGTYTLGADRKMTFSGAIGVIPHTGITDANQEMYAVHAFNFSFRLPNGASNSAACKL